MTVVGVRRVLCGKGDNNLRKNPTPSTEVSKFQVTIQ
jgi:hypothetical protein